MKAYIAFCSPLVIGVFQTANNALEFIVLLAAAMAACGVLWVRGVKPVIAFGGGISEAVAHIRSLPQFQREVLERQDEIMTRLEVMEGALYGSDMTGHLPLKRRNDPPYGR